MRSFFMMLLLIGAVWTVQGRVVDKMEADDDDVYNVPNVSKLYDDSEYVDDDGANIDDDYKQYHLDDQDVEVNYSDIFDDYKHDDDYEYEAEDESTDLASTDDYNDLDLPTGVDLADLKAVMQEYVDQNLGSCRHGRCTFCVKLWRYKLCGLVILSRGGVTFSVTFNGRTLYQRSFGVSRTITIRISRNRIPSWARWAFRSDLYITLYRIDVFRRRFCVSVRTRVRVVGTVRYRRCF